jgi:hypothetical protein
VKRPVWRAAIRLFANAAVDLRAQTRRAG